METGFGRAKERGVKGESWVSTMDDRAVLCLMEGTQRKTQGWEPPDVWHRMRAACRMTG